MVNNKIRGTEHRDNKIEDYFMELVIAKHSVDKEILDLLHVVDNSMMSEAYKILIRQILF